MFRRRLADTLALVRAWRRPLASVTIALVVMVAAGFALPSGAASLAQPLWSQLSPAASPSARFGSVMAYDPATSQLILFGGVGALGSLIETWVWAGTNWTQLSPAASPSDRVGSVMAYDPVTSQLILFGGFGGNNGSYLGDTWTWTGTTWSQLGPTTSPSARTGAVMAYDPATSQLILFGGIGLGGGFLGDTWTWTGTTWSQLSPATSPPVRLGAAMAYDPASSRLILFGGANTGGLGDTWVWTGTTWTQLSPAASPPSSFLAAIASDPVTSQLILFGGGHNSGKVNDTWSWTGTNWSQLSPATSPPARWESVMAYDPASSRLILFGGDGLTNTLGDTWAFQFVQTLAITSGSSTAFNVGTAGTFTLTTTGAPTPSVGAAGLLPNGVTSVDNHNGTATISGTPLAGSEGVYPLTIVAHNGVSPDANQSFTLTVTQTLAITSESSTAFNVGTAGTFIVTTTGFPIPSLSATGALPSGVTFVDNHNGTATLSGTPLAGTRGVYPLTIKASNGVSPDTSQSFTLTVTQGFHMYLPFVPN